LVKLRLLNQKQAILSELGKVPEHSKTASLCWGGGDDPIKTRILMHREWYCLPRAIVAIAVASCTLAGTQLNNHKKIYVAKL
jgi:hypothetical protein